MYHPTRGGVRGGRDQFKWEDVKVDKHRENYLGHSIMAPVGRWQKGKDLHWYARDKKSQRDIDAAKEEVKRIQEEDDRAIQEALGLAPKRSGKSHGNRLDKHEFQELVKRSSTAEDLGGGHAEAARVQGLGFSREPRAWEESSSLQSNLPEKVIPNPVFEEKKEAKADYNDDYSKQKKRRREEKEDVKHERQHRKHEKRHSRDSDDRKKHRHDKEKRRRHDSASD